MIRTINLSTEHPLLRFPGFGRPKEHSRTSFLQMYSKIKNSNVEDSLDTRKQYYDFSVTLPSPL